MLTVENHGPLITGSNFWGSDHAKRGFAFLSLNAGAFRLLLPPTLESALADIRTAREVVVSYGPWQQSPSGRGVEVLFDDGTADPFSLHLVDAMCDRIPPAEEAAKEWLFTAWTAPRRGGPPHQALQRPAWCRHVESLPWLKSRT